MSLTTSIAETIAVTLSGKDGAIHLQPFQTKDAKADGTRNTYFAVALPKKDGTTYPASHGVSPVALPDGLNTKVEFAGIAAVTRKKGTTKSDNPKVDLSVEIDIDGHPMVASITISDLGKKDAKGNTLCWLKPVVVNKGGGGFKAKTSDEVEASLFS